MIKSNHHSISTPAGGRLTWLTALIVVASASSFAWPYIDGLFSGGAEMAGIYLLILALCMIPVYMAVRMLFGSVSALLLLGIYCTFAVMIESAGLLVSSYLSASPGSSSVWSMISVIAPFAAVVSLFVCAQNALKKNGRLAAGSLYTMYYGLTWAMLLEMLCIVCMQQFSNFSMGVVGLLGSFVAGALAIWGVVSGRRIAFVLASLMMVGGAVLTALDGASGVNTTEAVLVLQCVLAAMFGVMAYPQKR